MHAIDFLIGKRNRIGFDKFSCVIVILLSSAINLAGFRWGAMILEQQQIQTTQIKQKK